MQFGQKTKRGEGVIAIGDSFTVGLNATSEAAKYVNRLGGYIGGAVANQGYGGEGWVYCANKALALNSDRSRLVTFLAGLNDIRISNGTGGYGAFPKIKANLHAALAACFLQESVPASKLTKSGNWMTLASVAGGRAINIGGTAMYTPDMNAYMEWEFFGETLVIGAIACLNSNGKMYSNMLVTIDNGPQELMQVEGQTNETYGYVAKVYKNLGFGKHTVRIQPADTTNYSCVLDYVGTLCEPWANGPVLVGHIPYVINYTTGTHVATPQMFTDANAEMDAIVAEWSDWGVAIVPTNDFFDPATGCDTDGVHPNNTGHVQIYNGFKSRVSLWS